MLKKFLKITGIILAVIVALAAGFYAKAYFSTEGRLNKIYTITPQPLDIATDSSVLAYGERLITTKGCNDCHSTDLGGKIFINDPALGLVVATNLTKGKGGIPSEYTTEDWTRALKHGIGRDGKPLLIMPSH